MEKTSDEIVNNVDLTPYDSITTDQNTRQCDKDKFLSNDHNKSFEIDVESANVRAKKEQFQGNSISPVNSRDNKELPSCYKVVQSIGDKSEKIITPQKNKYNKNHSNGIQRYNNIKSNYECVDTPKNVKTKIDFSESSIYAVSGAKNKTGSKKNNLNHLLNFNFQKSTSHEHYEYQKFSKQFWSNKITKNSHFTKEQFLQANCRFIVKNDGDYSSHLKNPDLLVEWSKIEEIHMDSSELISCPICLYPPTVGKMTKCGHIFCWSCILHYLSLSDKPWRKCPICFESIYKADLKSLVQNQFDRSFKVGDIIQFELMFRSKSVMNTVFLPYILFDQFKLDEQKLKNNSLELLNSETYSLAKKYLKLSSKSSNELLESIIDHERRQLNKQRENEKDQPEICFVDEALILLNEREKSLKISDDIKKNNSSSFDKKKVLNDMDKLTVNEFQSKKCNTDTVDNSVKTTRTSQQGLNDCQDFVIFYQSTDGQRIYLNALNTRMLLSEYSVFTNFPKYLNAKIVASESFFMSENNRKRFRYLSHLPLNSEFKIVEVELTDKISKDTLIIFEDEILERKRLRERKLLKESRLADRSDNKNIYDPHYYNISVMNEPNNIDYSQDFPESSTYPTTSSSSPHLMKENEKYPTSFAQMTKNQGINYTSYLKDNENLNSKSAWPSLGSNYQDLNLPQQKSAVTNGWLLNAKMCPSLGRSTKVQGPPSPKNFLDCYGNEDEEGGDYLPAPGYRESFFTGIDESLKVIDSKNLNSWGAELEAEEIQKNDSSLSKLSKKKKKNKKLLFST